MTIGMPANMSFGDHVPLGMVVQSSVLEEVGNVYELLEEYDPRPTLLDTAFYVSDVDDETDEEYERILDEDYDW